MKPKTITETAPSSGPGIVCIKAPNFGEKLSIRQSSLQPEDQRGINPSRSHHTDIFTVGRHTGTADKTGKDRRQTVPEEAAPDIRVEVAVRHHVNGFDMTRFQRSGSQLPARSDHGFRLETGAEKLGTPTQLALISGWKSIGLPRAITL